MLNTVRFRSTVQRFESFSICEQFAYRRYCLGKVRKIGTFTGGWVIFFSKVARFSLAHPDNNW